MKNLENMMADKRIGIVSAHPDDHLVHGNALQIARDLDLVVHELTLTKGRASTVNYQPDEAFVRNGMREEEGIKAAALLGIASNEHWDVPDGAVSEYSAVLASRVRAWMMGHGLDMILTMGGLVDHSDHIVSGAVAFEAGRELGLDVLELQSHGYGEWYAPTTTNALGVTLGAAVVHASQFREEDLSGLEQYPIWRDAGYVQL